ncbi:MAG TPA: PQQ-binding-like beta-propeller repeat protein [Candidatus Paceibacterota bacterium]|nr:PQQ-binding-like beta-propeller repeat protein [Verrucomicrobiota bacterium]HSA12347.1 PQQ-binding-like beta-propeller repeat protein [Candidatus Paceibacterota bacterium]
MLEPCLLIRACRRFRRTALLSLLLTLVPILIRAETSPLRFAWLSDTHVGSSTSEEDLRAAVQDINSLTGLSFVVVSGDVTEYGSREQLRLAKGILDGLKIPSYVVPGNHDTKWSESGATDFGRLWPADRFVFEQAGYCFIGLHQGPLMKMGDGHWAPQDVRWLQETLKKLPDPNQPIIFVTHYPIDEGIANWHVVLDLLKQYNTQVVLCGHGHANQRYLFEGVPGVMGRSSLRVRAPVGGFNLVEIKDGTMTFAERAIGRQTLPPWHSVALQKHDYAVGTSRYPRPNFSVNARYPNVKPRWTYNTGYTIASTPAVWKQLAIVGDASGTVYALALKSGRVRWKFKAGNAVYSTPEVSRDLVVFTSTDGNVYALKAANGKEAWRYPTSRPIVACPRIADGVVYVGSSEGAFRALDLDSGKLVWQFDGLAGFVETKPLAYDGQVIFGAWDQYLYALDAKTGKLTWKWKGDKPGALLSPAACWPVAADGKVFVVAPDRTMTALSAKSGEQLWRTDAYVVRESIGLSPDQTRFYVRAMNDFFYAFSTAAPVPEKIWELNAGFGYDINSAALAEKDGVVFYGTKNDLLCALDARTGALKWQHKLGTGVMNTVLPLSATQVLATDFDGRVALIEARP